jgi:hypothetical protein
MHTRDRPTKAIDYDGVPDSYTGMIVRDDYAGYAHPSGATHTCCGAYLQRDLASLVKANPDGQVWAVALTDARIDALRTTDRAARPGLPSSTGPTNG